VKGSTEQSYGEIDGEGHSSTSANAGPEGNLVQERSQGKGCKEEKEGRKSDRWDTLRALLCQETTNMGERGLQREKEKNTEPLFQGRRGREKNLNGISDVKWITRRRGAMGKNK